MGKRSNPIFIEHDLVDEEQQGGSRPGKRRHVSSQFAAIALLAIRGSSSSSVNAAPQKVVSANAAVKSAAVKDILLLQQEASPVTDDEFDDHSLVHSLSCIKENKMPSVSFFKNRPPPTSLALRRPVLARTAPNVHPSMMMMISSSKLPLGRPLPPAPLLASAQWVAKLNPINLSLVQESRK
jgi:hypothetical protein